MHCCGRAGTTDDRGRQDRRVQAGRQAGGQAGRRARQARTGDGRPRQAHAAESFRERSVKDTTSDTRCAGGEGRRSSIRALIEQLAAQHAEKMLLEALHAVPMRARGAVVAARQRDAQTLGRVAVALLLLLRSCCSVAVAVAVECAKPESKPAAQTEGPAPTRRKCRCRTVAL